MAAPDYRSINNHEKVRREHWCAVYLHVYSQTAQPHLFDISGTHTPHAVACRKADEALKAFDVRFAAP